MKEFQLSTSQPLGFSILYLAQTIASLVLAFYTNWKLTLVVLSIIPAVVICIAITSPRLQKYIKCQEMVSTQATRSAYDAVKNITVVKCFNGQQEEGHNYSKKLEEAARFSWKLSFIEAFQTGFIQFLSTSMFVQGK